MITRTSLKHPTVRLKLRKAMREAIQGRGANGCGCALIPGIGFCYYMPKLRGACDVSSHGFMFETLASKGPVRPFTHLIFGGAA